MKCKYIYSTDKAIHHDVNQDSVLCSRFCLGNDDYVTVLAVADGISGLDEGEKASFLSVKRFCVSLYEKLLEGYEFDKEGFSISKYRDRIADAVKAAICDANECVCSSNEVFSESGSTLSAVVIIDDFACIVNVGDSPIFYYDYQKKKFRVVSDIQNLGERDVRKEKYTRNTEEYMMNSCVLLNYLGKYNQLSDYYISQIEKLDPNDVIVIGTDGAFGFLSDNEVFRCLFAEDELSENSLKRLFDAVDDIDDDRTAVVAYFS